MTSRASKGVLIKCGTPAKQLTRLISPQLMWAIETTGSEQGELRGPVDVVLVKANRTAVVAEYDNNRLQVFNHMGRSKGLIADGKLKPSGIALEKADTAVPNLLVVDSRDKTVKRFSLEGDELPSWKLNMFGKPSGIATTKKGNIIVTDIHPDRPKVSVLDSEGKVIREFGCNNPGKSDYLQTPLYVTVDLYDRIFVSDHDNSVVKVFDMTGTALDTVGKGEIEKPNGVFCNAVDNLLIADSGSNSIALYSPAGKLIQKMVSDRDSIQSPTGVAVSDASIFAVTENSDASQKLKLYQV